MIELSVLIPGILFHTQSRLTKFLNAGPVLKIGRALIVVSVSWGGGGAELSQKITRMIF